MAARLHLKTPCVHKSEPPGFVCGTSHGLGCVPVQVRSMERGAGGAGWAELSWASLFTCSLLFWWLAVFRPSKTPTNIYFCLRLRFLFMAFLWDLIHRDHSVSQQSTAVVLDNKAEEGNCDKKKIWIYFRKSNLTFGNITYFQRWSLLRFCLFESLSWSEVTAHPHRWEEYIQTKYLNILLKIIVEVTWEWEENSKTNK